MAAITPVASVEEFTTALARSGLLSAEALAAAQQTAAASPDPKSLARELVKSGTLTKWQANQLLHGFHLLMVGKFKLLDQLGASDIGRAYLAEHSQIGRRHTLKVLAKRHLTNPEVVKRFLAEATQACGLDHRNISHVYDVSRDGDRCYMVMEYVEGEDLTRIVERSGQLPAREAAEFIRQAAEGLAHAHENGVFHGDLKPTNLMLDSSGTLKILGLGQAGLRTSPGGEQQESPASALDDIASLGGILCYLLTAKAASTAAEATTELAAAGAPAELAALCSRMMADDPAQRPGSMDAVLGELAALGRMKSAPPAATKPAEAPKAKKPPVARPLESPALPVARLLEESTPTEAVAGSGPFAIQAPGKGKKPAAKAAPPSAKAWAAGKKPLIIAAAIGGGVLVLAGIGVALALSGFFGSGDKPVAQAPKAEAPADNTPAGEANPAETNPVETNPGESNPVAPAEANPVAPAVATPADAAPNASTPNASAPNASAPNAAAPVVPTPPPGANSLAAAASPMPATPPVQTEPPAAALPASTTAQNTEPAPMPAEAPPAKTKTKGAADPFAGFAKAITLPPLPEMDSPPAEALAAQTLGPCQVDDQAIVLARLKGGETAVRGGRLKFDLQSTNGTEPRDWEFQLLGGEAPVVVATLAAKEGELRFAWTEAGVKQATQARGLANCAIELTAGAGRHVVALREPVAGPPLGVDFEKNAAVKWTIDNLPDPKAVYIEATQFDGLARQKLVPEGATSLGDDMLLWTGPADDAMYLCLKLLPTLQGRGVQMASAPQWKMPGSQKLERFSRKDAAARRQSADGALAVLTSQLNAASKKRSVKKGDAVDQFKNQIQARLDDTHKGVAALDQILTFVDSAKEGKIHFRVYHLAEDEQIDLLVTSGDAGK